MSKVVTALDSRGARVAATVVAFLALVLAGYVEFAQINLTRCLASYNEAAAQSSAARSSAYEHTVAADRVNTEAEDALWEAVQASASMPADQRQQVTKAAFGKFLTERQRAKQMRAEAAADRAKNPPPAPPSQRCD